MTTFQLLWVLGHRIRLIDTDDAYGMVEITSPPRVPGPPPHYHKNESEFFFVVQGTLDIMTNGSWQRYAAGSFVDVPPHTMHTFVNNSAEDVVWLTGWRPKGFERFFMDFGIPAFEAEARERSMDEELARSIAQSVERYGMYIVS